MTVGNVLYEDKKEAGEALIAACSRVKNRQLPAERSGNIMGSRYLLPIICSPMRLN